MKKKQRFDVVYGDETCERCNTVLENATITPFQL